MTTVRYFTGLLFTAAMIAAFPLTMRGQNGNGFERTRTTGQPDSLSLGKSQQTRTYRVSAYCQNSCCCGDSADGITASGHRITAADYGRLCAAPKSYPFGTKFNIEGYGIVESQDRGGWIKSAGESVGGQRLQYNRIDILMKDHQTAKQFGVKYLKATIQ